MDWEEFKERVKKFKYMLSYDDHKEMCEVVDKDGLEFYENGKIKTYMGDLVARDRTFNQMYTIVKVLEVKNEKLF